MASKASHSDRSRGTYGFPYDPLNVMKKNVKKVAVLYGSYHIYDMISKFRGLGLKEICVDVGSTTGNNIIAWKVPKQVSYPANDKGNYREINGTVLSPHVVFAVTVTAILYLLVGTVDWFLLFEFIVDAFRHLSVTLTSSDHQYKLHEGFIYTALLSVTGDTGKVEGFYIFAVLFVYISAYVQRHLAVLRTLSTVGIEWEKTD